MLREWKRKRKGREEYVVGKRQYRELCEKKEGGGGEIFGGSRKN